jgi:hypothetical protein
LFRFIYSIAEDRRIEFETQVRKAYVDFPPVAIQYRNIYREKLLLVQPNGL